VKIVDKFTQILIASTDCEQDFVSVVYLLQYFCLQCFDCVDWTSGRATGL